MNWLARHMGHLLARYLEQPSRKYEPFAVTAPETLRALLQPGDVLLVEGNQRISVAIKYLTQSTWSHAALYVGDAAPCHPADSAGGSLVEADLVKGVIAVPLDKYAGFNSRICRAVGLSDADRAAVVRHACASIGRRYDLKNVWDLLRYLLPTPPVPVRFRRRMLALGSGDPTRAICSTLIAEAFQSIRYPILPDVSREKVRTYSQGDYVEREILHIRHHSLFTPRDFDLSPYFRVVKPTLEDGFDFRAVQWADQG